jgi:hypothetical protein
MFVATGADRPQAEASGCADDILAEAFGLSDR